MGEVLTVMFWLVMIFFILPLVVMGVMTVVIIPLHWLLRGLRVIGLKDEREV